MARRGKRRAVAPNIYQDESGLSLVMKVAGRQVERRFPTGTPLAQLLDERDRLHRRQAMARPAAPGTLTADVLAYLATISDAKKRQQQQILCAHWVAAYGHVHRHALTPLVIRQQLAAWQRGGAAASSCNHRLSALRAVWRAVASPDEHNYPGQVKKLPEPPPEPRALPYALIRRILAALPDRGRAEKGQTRGTVSLTKLRLTLMAYTGLPPAQIMRIVPETDIDWQTPALRARPRRKGKGTRETWLPLIPPAVEALRALVAAGGLPGRFSSQSAYAVFQRAVKAIRATDPTLPHLRPYDLRHSFASMALSKSQDLAGVQHLLQHSTPHQTVRYTLSAVPAGAARAATLVAEALGASREQAKGAGTEKRKAAKGRQNRPKIVTRP